MTSTLPSGDGTADVAGPDGALDPDSAPATGLEPDTAQDAAGEQDAGTVAESDVTDVAAEGAAPPGGDTGRQPLGDPALDNEQDMRQAGADLQSSREKTATARHISDQLTAATRPERAADDGS